MVTALKVERIKRGVAQWQLASSLAISQTELSHYETGRRCCPERIRQQIAKELGVPVKVLFPTTEIRGS